MLEWWESAIEPHWPFLVAAVVFMVIGQVMKRSVFTRWRAYAQFVDELPYQPSHLPGQPRVRRKSRWFWWWAYKSMPMHPVLAGLAFGFFVQAEPELTRGQSMLYFAGAGAISVFLYQVLKGLLKRKGMKLPDLPGQSTPTPKRDLEPLPAPPKVPEVAKELRPETLPPKDTP